MTVREQVLIIIFTSVVLMCVHVDGRSRIQCNGLKYLSVCYGKHYTLEGQVVQAIPEPGNPSMVTIKQCRNETSSEPPPFDIEATLQNVTELNICYVNGWPPLPDSAKVERMEMTDVMPSGEWGSCSHLTYLRIISTDGDFLPPTADWLANCTLQDLILMLFKPASITAVVDTTTSIQVLTIDGLDRWERIVRTPIFPTPRGREQFITTIDVEESQTRYRYKWGDERRAQEANTTWDDISASLISQVSSLANLQSFSINSIDSFQFCPSGDFPAVTFPSLRNLTISDTKTRRVCLRSLRVAPQLTLLQIGNKLSELKFSELSPAAAPAPQLLVDADRRLVEWIPVDKFYFDRDDYYSLIDGPKRGNVTLSLLRLSIECDCQNGWFGRALREGLVTAPDVTCTDGRKPADQLPEWIECERFSCSDKCVCRQDWLEGNIVADCRRANLTELPPDLLLWNNLTGLNAAHNHIATLPKRFNDNLLRLDLSSNSIWQPDAEEVAALFAAPGRRLRLASNPLVCSCDNRVLLQALQEHRDQVEDYDSITCAGDASSPKISELDIGALCAARDRNALLLTTVSAALVLAATGLAVGVALYYRRQIQVFLFARGWCLWCLREEELDADCRYDVFLSFCHEDADVVMEQILPVLDSEYSVCVHYRDWNPGEMIPAQVTRSVERSRRTVVVVSHNFLKSLWGLLEFRTAHMHGLMEGRVRVVMVVLDDVLEGDVEGEVRAYVRLNTYVRWGDPWFWDKLRYALPHTPHPRIEKISHSERRRVDTMALQQY